MVQLKFELRFINYKSYKISQFNYKHKIIISNRFENKKFMFFKLINKASIKPGFKRLLHQTWKTLVSWFKNLQLQGLWSASGWNISYDNSSEQFACLIDLMDSLESWIYLSVIVYKTETYSGEVCLMKTINVKSLFLGPLKLFSMSLMAL